jgi:cobalt-precorrin 5A hydrolase
MTRIAVIALSRFEPEARRIAGAIGGEYLPYHAGVFREAFGRFPQIVACMACGIAVRGIAPLIRDKWIDPAVVVVAPGGAYAVPILGGHHGANDLARKLAPLGIIPVITTATEIRGRPSVEAAAAAAGCGVLNREATLAVNAALLDGDVPFYRIPSPGIVVAEPGVAVLAGPGEYVVGIGCRRGTCAEEVVSAVRAALAGAGVEPEHVMAYASCRLKMDEPGLAEGIRRLCGVLVFVDDAAINRELPPSPSRAGLIGLVGVAEPAALALAKRREIVLKKQVYGNVTVAIAR